ncbi:hypothetical protein HFO09_23230 [Rhizobium laguerreae]|uniref:hypothetical protein n=1 Tax=Rhizobium laguerreae TaxID=1076926 RepID=UPI001C91F974|nr:hypothetical protein [Rhizobium laguerreae]MBY3257070.1 hypothetical protein [Rhizobium laguerreae]MBY3282431.1 hypothetical protein [Rhizobium laguerreae]MBY3291958.1 hypothetical protein [Rhizobium laguerreae]
MSSKNVYSVLRSHEGDKFYKEGDERALSGADAKHLVDLGVLKFLKAAPTPKNKAAPAPKNKAH